MAPVPRPPADLLDRIKSDIPEYLRPDADRKRLTRSIAFNMRVAASILIIVSSVIGAIYLLAPQEAMMRMSPTPSAATVAEKKAVTAVDEVQVDIAQQAPPPAPLQLSDASVSLDATSARPEAVERTVSRRKEEATAEEVVAGAVAAVVANTAPIVAEMPAAPSAPSRAPESATSESISVAASAPAIDQRTTAKTATQSFIREARAADLALGPPSSVFGISIDDGVFHRIKETLEKNQRPTAGAVNVEAIINYFAGGPAKLPRRGVKLEVEGSPSPVGAVGRGGFLRFTIDTPAADSQLPVASGAKLEIDLNSNVVESAAPVGDSSVTAPESTLLHNLSVTGLYQLTLKPNVRLSDRVATVRLTYTSVTDGKRHSIDKAIYARDFARLWTRASHRHRVASLGAVWAESLKVSSAAPEVARRAEELATQNPGDARAQELATAATASSKLPASGF